MKFICCSSPTVVIPYASYPSYTAAGVVFFDSQHVLAAVQNNMKPPCLSGLGGRREATDLDWFDTAWREVIEELFHVRNVPRRLLTRLRSSLPSEARATEAGGYVLLSCSFTDLLAVLRLCKSEGLVSPLYTRIPSSLVELIMNRTVADRAEIGSLALLPRRPSPLTIHPLFQSDLNALTRV